uniref:Uncharacterized protein n=1 Tax=Leersia perrieri TaxID=77586 RepID=A0A0D9X742_9ORYZ
MCVQREVMEIVTYMKKTRCCYVHEVRREFRIYSKAFGMDGIHIWKACQVYFPKHQTAPYLEFSTLSNLHLKPCYRDRLGDAQEVMMTTWRRTSFARFTRTQAFPHKEIEDKKEKAQFGLVSAACAVKSKTGQTLSYGVLFGRLTTHWKAIFMAHVMDRDKDTEYFWLHHKGRNKLTAVQIRNQIVLYLYPSYFVTHVKAI